MDLSLLHFYSLGKVAANKALDSKDIEVTPIETLPMLDGELTDNQTTVTSKGEDSQGNAYSLSLNTTVTLKATWLNFTDTNRRTAPDVRRGENVLIWQYADQDKYYWTCNVATPDLRKLETVVHAISATQVETDKDSADTTYYLEVSSHRGIIHIHTSKKNGEPFTYDWQLNTKDGSWLFTDDIGNFMSLDSKNVRIELKNSDGSWIDMNHKVINIFAPDTVNITADTGNINMKAGTDITHQAGKNITSKAGQSITLNAGTNYALQTGTDINVQAGTSMSEKAATTYSLQAGTTISTKAVSTTNTVPLTSFTGSVVIAGTTTTTGMSSLAGGAFTVNAPGTFTKPVTVQQLTSTEDIIAPNVSH